MRNYIMIEDEEIFCTANIQTVETEVEKSIRTKNGEKYTEYETVFTITYENGRIFKTFTKDKDEKRPAAKRLLNTIYELLED